MEARVTSRPEKVPPPGAADKLRRLCWQGVWLVLFRLSPTPLHGWRRLLLRGFGAKVGAGAHPYPSARIWAPWHLTLGAGSCLGPGSDVYNVAPVTIGERAVVSQKAYLCTAGHDIQGPGFALTAAPIVVGAGAWIAAAAFVGPGVTVENRAVVGACAVVTRNVASGTVVAGNPARPVAKAGDAFADPISSRTEPWPT